MKNALLLIGLVMAVGCGGQADSRVAYTVSAFCGESKCPWNPHGIRSDSVTFMSAAAAVNQVYTWAGAFGIDSKVVDAELAFWGPGQDMDIEFPLDGGRQFDVLLYTDKIQ